MTTGIAEVDLTPTTEYIAHQTMEVLADIAESDDMDSLCSIAVNRVPQLVGAKVCSIFLRRSNKLHLLGTTQKAVENQPNMAATLVGQPVYLEGQGFTGWVAEQGLPLRVANVLESEADIKSKIENYRKALKKSIPLPVWSGGVCHDTLDDRQFMGVPIRIGHKTVGVLRASISINSKEFGPFEEQLLLTIATQIGAAIKAAHNKEKQLVQTTSLLQSFMSESDVSRICSIAVQEIPKLIGAKVCMLYLKHGDDLTLTSTNSRAKDARDKLNKRTHRLGFGLTGWVGKEGLPLRIHDVTDKHALSQIADNYSKALRRRVDAPAFERVVRLHRSTKGPYLGVPITSGREILGVLEVILTRDDCVFTTDSESWLLAIAAQVGAAITNAHSHTGRRQALEAIQQELALLNSSSRELDGRGVSLESVCRASTQGLLHIVPGACCVFIRQLDETDHLKIIKESITSVRQPPGEIPTEVTRDAKRGGVSGLAACTRRTTICNDVQSKASACARLQQLCAREAERQGNIGHKEYFDWIRSAAAMPLTLGPPETGELLGVLVIVSDEVNIFDEQTHEPVLTTYARLSAITMAYARLSDQSIESQRNAWMEISQISRHKIINRLATLEALRVSLLRQIHSSGMQSDEAKDMSAKVSTAIILARFSIERVVRRFRFEFNDLDPTQVDVNELLRGLGNEFAEATPGISFQYELDVEVPRIEADEDKLIEAFSEIIANAVRATGLRGSIRLQTSRIGKLKVPPSKRSLAEYFARIDIIDSGNGIDAKLRHRIFDKGYTTNLNGGQGLGLYFVRKDVAKHGGWIEAVASNHGHIKIILPIKVSIKKEG